MVILNAIFVTFFKISRFKLMMTLSAIFLLIFQINSVIIHPNVNPERRFSFKLLSIISNDNDIFFLFYLICQRNTLFHSSLPNQHCFICRPSDSSVSEDAGIEPMTVPTIAMAVRCCNLSARSHPFSDFHPYLHIINCQLGVQKLLGN